jgi:hypothetical protein
MKNKQFLRGFLVGAVVVCILLFLFSLKSGSSLLGSVTGGDGESGSCIEQCMDSYDESVYDCNEADAWDICINNTEDVYTECLKECGIVAPYY